MNELATVSEFVSNPIIVILLAGLPATALGILGYRRAEKLDRVAAHSAAVSESATAVQQVIDGLNHIVDNLQDDNKVLRDSVDNLSKRLRSVIEENRALKGRVDELTRALP